MNIDHNKSKKVWVIWLVIAILVIVMTAVAIPLLVFALSKNETRKNVVADVSVLAFRVSELDEECLFEEGFSFSAEDVDATKRTTTINAEINQKSYIKLVYNVTNETGELYCFKLDFDGVYNKNCKVSYMINNSEEFQMGGQKIFSTISQNISIAISIKVDNVGFDSKFVGNILFSVVAT